MLNTDADAISAALLHDVVEDTNITVEVIRNEFNDEIAFLVESLTKTSVFESNKTTNLKYEYIRKILISLAKDIRVILIKIADRLHNMETLEFKSMPSQKRISKETLEVYVPIVHRLGIHSIKAKLEDLCFKYLNYDKYLEIKKIVNNKIDTREKTLVSIIASIKKLLSDNGIKEIKIYGRNKHFYSIYRKMYLKGKKFNEIFDLTAISIIVKNKLQCYEVLGLIHNNFPIISNRFKDYISTPKSNNYKAIHTNILLNKNFFEIQIRDYMMEQIALWGSASHWDYKVSDKNKNSIESNDNIKGKIPFLKYINEELNNDNFNLNIQKWHKEIMNEDICVLTFDGDVIMLPDGSTVLDFAYRIHTNIGNHAKFAYVNGKKSPIMKPLKTGDVVEIAIDNSIFPKLEWLEFVKTNRAVQSIKRYLTKSKVLSKTISEKIGIEIINNYLSKNPSDVEFFNDKKLFNAMIKNLNYHDEEDFYVSVYQNDINLKKLFNEYNETNRNVTHNSYSNDKIKNDIEDSLDKEYVLSKCCNPIPGDKVITEEEESILYVHRERCHKKNSFNNVKKIKWNKNTLFNYEVKISVKVKNRPDGLKDIMFVFSSMSLNVLILYANSVFNKKLAIVEINFTISNLEELNNLFILLKNIQGVLEVQRISGNKGFQICLEK